MSQQYSMRESSRSQRGWMSQYNPSQAEDRYAHERHQRGLMERAGDEVRSWFGDEEAERRRMLDERYDRHHYGARTESFGDVRARDVMTRNVVTVHPWQTVEQVARIMGECDCGSLPVVNENGRLLGMVTDRDIAIRIAGRGKDPRHARVDECMSVNIIACHEYDSIENCMRQLSRHQIRRLPIVDDRDRVIGIISQGDLAWHAGTHPGWGERRALADTLCAISEPTHAPRR